MEVNPRAFGHSHAAKGYFSGSLKVAYESPRMSLSSVKGKTAIPSSDLSMKHGYCVHKNKMCEDKGTLFC